MSTRSFLFLQGVASPFFDRLAKAIRQSGIKTCRVKFCGGDLVFHKEGEARLYNGSHDELADFYNNLFKELSITDIVLFGDTRPVHIDAVRVAKERQLNIHVFEEGYLRPDWITLDSGGVNAYSPVPKLPCYFRDEASKVQRGIQSAKTNYSQWVRLAHDIRYNTGRLVDIQRFPNYRRHRIESPVREYLGWIIRYPKLLPSSLLAKRKIKKLNEQKAKYYVYPLQLDGDSQIRIHSKYKGGVAEATEEVLRSFAAHASKRAYLIVKNHPLDTGINKHKQNTLNLSKQLGIRHRVLFFDGGHLPTLLSNAKGTVLVNSTTGMSALFHGSPVIALGEALYDMPGLTFQGGLDDFWCKAKKPNAKLFRDFRDVLIHKTQINGNFYTKKGIEMAIAGSLKRMNIPPAVYEEEVTLQDSNTITI